MNLKLPNHIQDMIQYRGLSMDHIKSTIRTPDKKTSRPDNKILAIKKFGDKTMEVVYCKEGFRDKDNQYIVITAYYL